MIKGQYDEEGERLIPLWICERLNLNVEEPWVKKGLKIDNEKEVKPKQEN